MFPDVFFLKVTARGFGLSLNRPEVLGLVLALVEKQNQKLQMRWSRKAAAKGRIRLHQELSPTTSVSWLVLWHKFQREEKSRFPGGMGLHREC